MKPTFLECCWHLGHGGTVSVERISDNDDDEYESLGTFVGMYHNTVAYDEGTDDQTVTLTKK